MRCLYQTVPFSKLYLNGFEDKQQRYWINNKGQEIDTCSVSWFELDCIIKMTHSTFKVNKLSGFYTKQAQKHG